MKDVFLDNSRINAMAVNPLLVGPFPFLAKTVTKQGGGCCGGRGRPQLDYDYIKSAVAALPAGRKQELKRLMKVEALTVVLPGGVIVVC